MIRWKRSVIALAILLMIHSVAFAARVGPIPVSATTSANVATIPIVGEVTVYTKSISLKSGEYFGIMYKATSDGTVNLSLEVEQSWTRPTTEGSSDAQWVEPSDIADVDAAITDEIWHARTLALVPLPYLRFRIIGLTGNDASTTIQIKVSKQEG